MINNQLSLFRFYNKTKISINYYKVVLTYNKALSYSYLKFKHKLKKK